MADSKKYLLSESDIPRAWFNIIPSMPVKPAPMLSPATRKPLTVEELFPLFSEEAARQEMNTTDSWIEIPDDVRDLYKIWRPTPLVRAAGLEKAIGTACHIYFKNESVSPVGSHKLNSAIPQAYYCKKQGVTNITTETGAGQWGAALALATRMMGIDLAVYMVKISCSQKPYRRSIMQTYGAEVVASPSMSTKVGRRIITENPKHQGSLGTAISEAVELAMGTPNCKYALGSVLNHVALHQTVIGLEAEKQMEMAGEYPDVVIGCFGGGSNFSGIAFPFMRHNFSGERSTWFVAAEPESCPKLTRGEMRYDFGDEAGYTPLIPMLTLGHDFAPANIHAGGLRYHGAGAVVSCLKNSGLMDAVDIPQLESFDAATLFAGSEGIIPAPESAHAIAAAIREARAADEAGTPRTILFNLSGHGLIDMSAYDRYLAGDLANYSVSSEEIAANIASLSHVD